ncbi:response regulator transcription factor [Alteromonas sp. NFXS44]|uniref:response regulator transcription factor n=1 Tax=Alteromonas sp. NFXS44 TaxID=2818435 RepID=UPI0032DE3E71
MTIKIVLADDHVIMRQGLIQMLEADGQFTVTGECGDGVSLINLVITQNPDVVIMDISMPEMSGLVAIDKILTQRPMTRVLVLSMHNEREYMEAMFDAGAKGYLQKETSADELLCAIKQIASGKSVFPGLEGAAAPASGNIVNPLSVLTRREREVFFLVAAGNTSKKIAELLTMSLKTAENHRSNMYKKLNVTSSAELIRLAGKAGLLE